jgi:hypothetical protein
MFLFDIINRIIGKEVLEGEVLDPIGSTEIVEICLEPEVIDITVVIDVEPVEIVDTYVIYFLPYK